MTTPESFNEKDLIFWGKNGLRKSASAVNANYPFRFNNPILRNKIELSSTLKGSLTRMVIWPPVDGGGLKIEVSTGSKSSAISDPITFNIGGDCKLKNILITDPDYRTQPGSCPKENRTRDLFGKSLDESLFPPTTCQQFYITPGNCTTLATQDPDKRLDLFEQKGKFNDSNGVRDRTTYPILKDYGINLIEKDQYQTEGAVFGVLPDSPGSKKLGERLGLGYLCKDKMQFSGVKESIGTKAPVAK
jgi:hypothetical protein